MNFTHGSINSKIADHYGVVWQNKVKLFARLRIKRVKYECGLVFTVQCRNKGVVPKFVEIRPIKCFTGYEDFFRTASEKLLRRVIGDYRRRLICVNKALFELHLQLAEHIDSDLWNTIDAMTYSRSETVRENIKKVHNRKLDNLVCDTNSPRSTYYPLNNAQDDASRPAVVNLSSVIIRENSLNALARGLNFAPTPRHLPVESIICNIEDMIFRNSIPARDAECLRQDIATFLRRASLPKSNVSKEERQALRDLRNNDDILILPADKGNATVIVDKTVYEDKIKQLLADTNTYKKVDYNPTSRTTNRILKIIQAFNDKNLLSRLRPHNPTSPKIYGLPKIHKPCWPLRPIVSQIDSPTYKASRHLATLLQPFTGKTSSHVKDSKHFVSLMRNETIADTEIMVSFDVESLFTNIPVEEVCILITDILMKSNLPTGYRELMEFCLKSGYFAWRGEFYLQVDGVAMGSPIAPVAANIFMEWVESELVSNMPIRPRRWVRYVDDVFAIVNRGELAEVVQSLNGLHRKVQFTVEEEQDGRLPFLDVLVIRSTEGRLGTTVYRKPTHTNRYLHASSHHHPAHLSAVPRSLINRAFNLCDPPYIDEELRQVRHSLQSNGYKWRQSYRLAQNSGRPKPIIAERSPTYLTYVKGVTDKIAHYLRRKFSITTRFRPPGQIRSLLRSPKDKNQLDVPGVYRIPCDCGMNYIGETGRNVQTRVLEHIRSVKNVDINGSAIAEHILDSGATHYIRFDKASVLSTEKFLIPRKIREAIEISRHSNFNRDQGLALPAAWRPLIGTKSKTSSSLESDTVSSACLKYQNDNNSTATSDDESADPPPPPTSAREQRQQAREARRAVCFKIALREQAHE